jgi:hypothetical protein
MNGSLQREIEAWESEGGAAPAPLALRAISLAGTPNQVEWAERIRRQVNGEFDRVAASFRAIADRQNDDKRANTEAIIAILEDKRAEVMSREQAGYFVHDWQEIGDQVRQLIFQDARYQAITEPSFTRANRRTPAPVFRPILSPAASHTGNAIQSPSTMPESQARLASVVLWEAESSDLVLAPILHADSTMYANEIGDADTLSFHVFPKLRVHRSPFEFNQLVARTG